MTIGDVKSRFGTALRNERVERRISQEELAGRAGLHRTYISDVERGARNLSLENIDKLARALGLSVARLFAGAGQEPAPGALMEILLIEDDPQDVELAVRAFRKARISNRLLVARDGVEAIQMLFPLTPPERGAEPGLPGIILLDLNLPRIDGLSVLRRLKSEARTRRIPVIVLTTSSDDANMAACRALGVENYIVKPVGFQNFAEVMPQFALDWALLRSADEGTP